MKTPGRTITPDVSIVVPCYNESDSLFHFHGRLRKVLERVNERIELLFIDDGSVDDTRNIIETLKVMDPRVGSIFLSRNFGKEAAMTAGIDHARGDAVIVIDSDLQDPPEQIPAMIRAWRGGYDVVVMKRADRASDSFAKRVSAGLYYKLLRRLSSIEIPENVGDFRLMSRRAVEAVKSLPERNRYMKGLFAWVGFNTIELEFTREARAEGDSKWPVFKLIGLALDGITSFSIAPLRLASLAGAAVAGAALLYALFVFLKTLFIGDDVAGFPTLAILVSFLGGAQLMAIGIVGEYIGRLLIETKQRPLYLTESVDLPLAVAIDEHARPPVSLVQ